MTPEEAQALDPGTTPGPWEAYTVPGDRTTADYAAVSLDDREMVVPPRNGGMGTALDAHLIAAAPDMRATIAAQTWEYGVEQATGTTRWFRSKAMADAHAETYGAYLLVRRPVGPVEVVEG